MPVENLFSPIPDSLPEELENILSAGNDFQLKRIVSRGHTTDWYDQDQDEWVVLLSGAATLEFEGGNTVDFKPGDYLLIPAHQRHRVCWTDPEKESVWLALFFTARNDSALSL